MNLLLHWLRWDLRRFSSMLWLWCLSVAAYGIFVGDLNSDLQFGRPDAFRATKPLGITLLTLEAVMLFRLFSSDPCAGASPQWKTRPPAGWTVGVSKIVIAAVFYLGVPLFTWWLVLAITGNGADKMSTGGTSWMERLGWTQALLIALCLFVSSAAQSSWGVVVRIIVLTLVVVCVLATHSRLSHGMWFSGAAWQMQPAGLWLIAGMAVHLFSRWRRTPGPATAGAAITVPLLLAMGGAALPFYPAAKPSFLTDRQLDPELAGRIRLGEPLLFHGVSHQGSYGGINNDDSGMAFVYTLILHLQGLPQDCRATGFWRDITLITPDGRRIEAVDREERASVHSVERPVGWGGSEKMLVTAGAIFRKHEVQDLGPLRCSIEGTLRIRVEQRREKRFPLEPGKVMTGPAGHIRVDEVPVTFPEWGASDRKLLLGAFLQSELTEEAWWWVEHRQHRTFVPFWMRRDLPVSGWFIEPRMAAMTGDRAYSPHRLPLPPLRLRRDSGLGRLGDWDFCTGWYETLGFTNIRITLHEVMLPGYVQTEETARSLFPSLKEDASPEEVRAAVRYALHLDDLMRLNDAPRQQHLKALLAGISHDKLSSLLDVVRSEWPFLAEHKQQRWAVELRIAELATPADVAAIRKDKGLFDFLREELAYKGLIAEHEANPPGAEIKTNEQLRSDWLEGDRDADAALVEAVKRGLPWVPEALGELAGYRTLDVPFMLYHAARELARHSDFPKFANETDTNWLRANGARIRWDDAAKRWVLPAP